MQLIRALSFHKVKNSPTSNAAYILDIQLCNGLVIARLSDQRILLYSRSAPLRNGPISQISTPVTEIACAPAVDARNAVIYATDAQGLRTNVFDTRSITGKPIDSLRSSAEEPLSVSVNASNTALAVGTGLKKSNAVVNLWDLRDTRASLRTYDEAHSDDISVVKFHPANDALLLTAGLDSVVNTFDITDSDPDEAWIHGTTVSSSVNQAGWFRDSVWAFTTIESVELLDSELGRLYETGDVRAHSVAGVNFDYVITVAHDPVSPTPFLLLGTNSGDVAAVDMSSQWSILWVLSGVHSDVVRAATIDWDARLLYTGGEDNIIAVSPLPGI